MDGNCRPINTKILLENEIKNIQDIIIGDKVLTVDGYKKVNNIIYQGKQKLYGVVTEVGKIYCTLNHSLAIYKNENIYNWKKVYDLTEDDKLIGNLIPVEGSDDILYYKRYNGSMFYDNNELNKEIAWTLGYIYNNNNIYRNNMVIKYKTIEEKEKLLSNLQLLFNLEKLIEYNDKNLLLTFYSKDNTSLYNIHDLSRFLEMMYSLVTSSHKEIRYSFIAGIIDKFNSNKLELNNKICTDLYNNKYIKSLLSSLGILTCETQNIDIVDIDIVDKDLIKDTLYNLYIYISKYSTNNNIKTYRKKELKHIQNSYFPINILYIQSIYCENIYEHTFDITVEENEQYYDGDGILNHNSNIKESQKKHNSGVSGNTRLQCKNGIFYIKDLVDKEIEIFNGKEWSNVKPYISNYEEEFYSIKFNDGSKLKVTKNHLFKVKEIRKTYNLKNDIITFLGGTSSNEIIYKDIYAYELYEKGYENYILPKFDIPIIYCCGILNCKHMKSEYKHYNLDVLYTLGFFMNFGKIIDNNLYLDLSIFDENIIYKLILYTEIKYYDDITKFAKLNEKMDYKLCEHILYNDNLPEEIMRLESVYITFFLSGWLESLYLSNNNLSIYSNNKLRDLQLLLRRINIHNYIIKDKTSVSIPQKFGISSRIEITTDVDKRNSVYRLYIHPTNIISFKIINNYDKYEFNDNQYIINIKKISKPQNSYSLKESITSIFNNVLTYT